MRTNRIGLVMADKSDQIADFPDAYNTSMERITQILEEVAQKIRELGAMVDSLEQETRSRTWWPE